ncbi:MAG: arginase family protein [Candidatus Bathyarchaeia archaeon]|nr:arginase family protein [Candidatus Bathyarchaeota archaeon]
MSILFFGVPLDPDDREERCLIKRAYIYALIRGHVPTPNFLTPYEALMHYLQEIFVDPKFVKLGEIPVESWLRPKPSFRDLSMINPDTFSAFLAADCCRDYAEMVNIFVRRKVLPNKFVMIGVDHSSTGGCLKALTSFYGVEKIGVIILDSHFDAFHAKLGKSLFTYIKEHGIPAFMPHTNNFEGLLELDAPETYNSGSFLRYLLEERVILPENVIVIGVADYPSKGLEEIEDERVKKWVSEYRRFEREGVLILPRTRLKREGMNPLKMALNSLRTPFIYISLDIDVMSFREVYAARILNTIGLDPNEVYEILEIIKKYIIKKGIELVGFDLMEIDVHAANAHLKNGIVDRTYDISKVVIRKIIDGMINGSFDEATGNVYQKF